MQGMGKEGYGVEKKLHVRNGYGGGKLLRKRIDAWRMVAKGRKIGWAAKGGRGPTQDAYSVGRFLFNHN
jgi:hypothetical protein